MVNVIFLVRWRVIIVAFTKRSATEHLKKKTHIFYTCAILKEFDGFICNTFAPGDYDSFAAAILSRNYRDINIAESILVSIKVIIA